MVHLTLLRVLKLMEHFREQKKLHKRYALQLIEICRERLKSYQSLVDYDIGDEE